MPAHFEAHGGQLLAPLHLPAVHTRPDALHHHLRCLIAIGNHGLQVLALLGLVNSPQTARQAALRAMWDEAATENYGQYNRLEVPHMLLDDVRVGDVVELNTPTAGQTFHVFVYEIAEDEVRYRYGLMGASVGQCLMSNIVRVVGPDEEGISI